jgi:ATP-dependent DNA helicase RecG
LRKVLQLEVARGYRNTAVIGGLESFLQYWALQAGEAINGPVLLWRFRKLDLDKSSYDSLNLQQRQAWIKSILAFLPELEHTHQEPAITASAPVTAPPKHQLKRTPAPEKTATGESVDAPVTTIKGISSVLAAKFKRLGVSTVRDLLYFFPNRHLDYSQRTYISQIAEGKEQTIMANVWQARVTMLGGRRGTEAIVGDETGNIRVVWFNNPYLAKQLHANAQIVLSGRVRLFKSQHVMESPEWEIMEDRDLVHTGRLVPLYPLTQGLHQRPVRKLLKEVVDYWAPRSGEFLPASLRGSCGLDDLTAAIAQAHFPDNIETKDRARTRLAFDELFLLQLGVLTRKRQWQEGQPGTPFEINTPALDAFIKSLSFALTAAQQRALHEILADLQKSSAMSRLLQGDVGSGKTVVATAALLMAAAAGFQGAFMAPTEILAGQHYITICQLLAKAGRVEKEGGNWRSYSGILARPITVALLTGEVARTRKREVQKMVMSGDIDLAIGTHALLQKGVSFRRLGLAVVDEQQRFGVSQRSVLRQKGFNPHMLVMTATPIPRTLALTLYGDLDLSVIDQLPPGRQTIKTKWVQPPLRESAYAFIRKQVKAGHQAFVICPLIEESEAIEAKAAVAEYERLSAEVFHEFRLGLIHGRMRAAEKDDVMSRFHAGELDILVSTPVVEVGIDVPNATVMMVESADRFGLAQLHQFRGRVGRGEAQSYCMLLAEDPTEVGERRLDIIEKERDGFRLAEEDLKLRGPGEFFGTRQSGLPDLRMARLSDVALLETARREAIRLFKDDPDLSKPENAPLAAELARVWRHADTEFS